MRMWILLIEKMRLRAYVEIIHLYVALSVYKINCNAPKKCLASVNIHTMRQANVHE